MRFLTLTLLVAAVALAACSRTRDDRPNVAPESLEEIFGRQLGQALADPNPNKPTPVKPARLVFGLSFFFANANPRTQRIAELVAFGHYRTERPRRLRAMEGEAHAVVWRGNGAALASSAPVRDSTPGTHDLAALEQR